MNKRLLSLLLTAALLWQLVPGAAANPALCFVAMNDAVPVTLTDGAAPYYNKGTLFIPYTAFRANPNGVGASYNAEKETFVLFNSQEMLIFDLEARTYTDNAKQVYDVTLAYRSGLLYIPASVASHFGLSVTMLTSRDGYPIIRFTNGEQVYDDGMFVAQAESLINHVAQEYRTENGQQPDNSQQPDDSQPPEDGDQPPEENPSAEIYLAFAGDAVSMDTVRKLAEHGIHAAFFLTEDQITLERDLVRAIYAGGHTVGLTVTDQETDVRTALEAANAELDDVLFCRTVLALLPQGYGTEDGTYHILTEPDQPTVEEALSDHDAPQLYVVRTGALGVIESFVSGSATLLQLLETTF